MKKLLCCLSTCFFIISCDKNDYLDNGSHNPKFNIKGTFNKKEGFLEFENKENLKNSYFK